MRCCVATRSSSRPGRVRRVTPVVTAGGARRRRTHAGSGLRRWSCSRSSMPSGAPRQRRRGRWRVPPEAAGAAILDLFERVGRRVRWLETVRASRTGIAAAIGVALAALLIGWRARPSLTVATIAGLVIATGLVWRSRARWSRPSVGALIERAVPDSRNVVFTARELLVAPDAVAPWMRRHVIDAAGAVASRVEPAVVVPFGRDLLWLVVLSISLVAIALGAPERVARAAREIAATAGARPSAPPANAPLSVSIEIAPPAYTGMPRTTVTNP